MRGVETGGRADQPGQFEEGGNVSRGIRAHWLFKSPIRGRRGIADAEEVHWNGKFHTERELEEAMGVMVLEVACSSRKTKHQGVKKFV